MALGAGTTISGLGLWVRTSNARAARYARRFMEDAQRSIAPIKEKPDPAAWNDNAITVTWIGHSTALINFYGLRILTDPVLGNRVGLSLGWFGTAGIKRYVAPALSWRDLPKIHLLLLSHAHMDHMDLPTLRRFPTDTPTVSAPDTDDLLISARRYNLSQLRWGESTICRTSAGELSVEAFEVKHWGQRWPSKKPRGYNGYVLRREGRALLFGGDTARTATFREIRNRGPFELALMPIGAYRPWIWNHCSPEQALEMANLAQARYVVPIHHQTFKLSEEPLNEPIERLKLALEREPERLALSQAGETFTVRT